MMRVADYIADFIHHQGVRDIFMLSGGGSIYLDDGIACNNKLNAVFVRNEATAPMMAEAYSRLNGNLGVVYVTTGPGGANAVSGVVEAFVDSAPVLVISGQDEQAYTTYNANIKGFRTFGTQELNIVKVVKPITKYAAMVSDPTDIRYHLDKAVHLAKCGRPGPVWLDIPLDVQSAMIDESRLKGFRSNGNSKYDDIESKVLEVVTLLKVSRKPLIIAGQGVRIGRAIGEFKHLLEKVGIPAVFSRLGQDILPFSHKNNFGHGGVKGTKLAAKVMKEADLILSLGSRLAVPFVKNQLSPSSDKKLVMVDVDTAELSKPSLRVDVAVRADTRDFITKLLDVLKAYDLPDYMDWLEVCRRHKKENPLISKEMARDPIDLYYFVSRLDALSNENHIFVSDAGSSYYITGQVLQFEKGQREITSGTFASMGLAIPLAIGCSVAQDDAQILAITGDGSLELNIQELKTMSYYNLNIKLFVINNGGYVSIRNTQDALCEGRYIGSDQGNGKALLNFPKIAEGFDLPYYRIGGHEEIDDALLAITAQKGPAFVEVVCDNDQTIIDPQRN
jgi:acetolactate synthase I/II/III large subunit